MNYRAAPAREKIKFQRDKRGYSMRDIKYRWRYLSNRSKFRPATNPIFPAVRAGEEPISTDCRRSINNHASLACYLRVLNEPRDIRGTEYIL